jgi:thiamine-phosphate pyrophosphorylase
MQSSLPSKNEHKHSNLRGLYAITDSTLLPQGHLVKAVEEAIKGGACAIQYRDKNASAHIRKQQALELSGLCKSYQTPLIINDDIGLAKEVGATGVHLGNDDATIHEARKLLGNHALIGISCYNSLEQAYAAEAAGANYIAFGSFYSSPTKPDAVKADLSLLQEAKRQLKIPLVAIGGITIDNGAALINAGADMIAVINAVFGQTEIEKACRGFSDLFSENKLE